MILHKNPIHLLERKKNPKKNAEQNQDEEAMLVLQ